MLHKTNDDELDTHVPNVITQNTQFFCFSPNIEKLIRTVKTMSSTKQPTSPKEKQKVVTTNDRPARSRLQSFHGSIDEEKRMLTKAVNHLLKAPKSIFATPLEATKRQRLAKKFELPDLTLKELQDIALSVITSKHTMRQANNPSRLKFSTNFITQFHDDDSLPTTSDEEAMNPSDEVEPTDPPKPPPLDPNLGPPTPGYNMPGSPQSSYSSGHPLDPDDDTPRHSRRGMAAMLENYTVVAPNLHPQSTPNLPTLTPPPETPSMLTAIPPPDMITPRKLDGTQASPIVLDMTPPGDRKPSPTNNVPVTQHTPAPSDKHLSVNHTFNTDAYLTDSVMAAAQQNTTYEELLDKVTTMEQQIHALTQELAKDQTERVQMRTLLDEMKSQMSTWSDSMQQQCATDLTRHQERLKKTGEEQILALGAATEPLAKDLMKTHEGTFKSFVTQQQQDITKFIDQQKKDLEDYVSQQILKLGRVQQNNPKQPPKKKNRSDTNPVFTSQEMEQFKADQKKKLAQTIEQMRQACVQRHESELNNFAAGLQTKLMDTVTINLSNLADVYGKYSTYLHEQWTRHNSSSADDQAKCIIELTKHQANLLAQIQETTDKAIQDFNKHLNQHCQSTTSTASPISNKTTEETREIRQLKRTTNELQETIDDINAKVATMSKSAHTAPAYTVSKRLEDLQQRVDRHEDDTQQQAKNLDKRLGNMEKKFGKYGKLATGDTSSESDSDDEELNHRKFATKNPVFKKAAATMNNDYQQQVKTNGRPSMDNPYRRSPPPTSPSVGDIEFMKTLQDNLHKFNKGTIGNIFSYKGKITSTQMEYYYDAIAGLLLTNGLPITPRQQLKRNSTSYPTDHPYNQEQFDLINSVVFQKILSTIPETNNVLQDIIRSHAADQDGYGALYDVMRHHCQYLRDLGALWGPEWQFSQTGYTYGADLRSHIDAERRSNRFFSRREVAAEILQQAMRHGRYRLTATVYLQRLTGIVDDEKIGEDFKPGRLLTTLEQNSLPIPDPAPAKEDQTTNLQINKTQTTVNKRFYRRSVQCSLCKTYGHDVDQDICRFAAQFHSVMTQVETTTEIMEKNASAYVMANNKHTVKMVCHEVYDEDSQYKLEQLALGWINEESN